VIAPVALNRSCDLRDFPNCLTVADWQQRLAEIAWALWTSEHHVRTREGALVVNWSGCEFLAPGPSATYQYGPKRNGLEYAVPAVYGLSVLDHTDAPMYFLQQAAQILRPHGLLYLTFAFWNADGEDTATGNEGRMRIYSATSYRKLLVDARRAGFQVFGGTDWTYHGDKLDDHTLASLVLTRR